MGRTSCILRRMTHIIDWATLDTGWQTVNGQGVYSSSSVSARVVAGVCYVVGTIYRNSGSVTSGDTVLTMPVGMRSSGIGGNVIMGGTTTTVHKISFSTAGVISVTTAGAGNHINIDLSYPVL